MEHQYEWCPVKSIENLKYSFGCYAVVVLNQPILIEPETITDIWNCASFRSTADGGTDRWLTYVTEHGLQVGNKFPNIVSGDFDSVLPETLQLCKENGAKIIHTPDVDKTDFTKAVELVAKNCTEKLDSIVAISENSGRLDQTFSNLNTLSKIQDIFQRKEICAYLISKNLITWILRPGYHKLHIPEKLRKIKKWCGILPFAPKKSKVTTTGLKWNLNNSSIEFGGLISSSNTYSGEPFVTIETDTELIWCMGIRSEN